MDDFVIHSCEQVLRFTQVSNWNNLSEERKVQLAFNLGAMSHGLKLTKEEGFQALSDVRQGIETIQVFREKMQSLIESRGIKVSEANVNKPF